MPLYYVVAKILNRVERGIFIVANNEEHAIEIGTKHKFEDISVEQMEEDEGIKKILSSGKTGFVSAQLDLFDNAKVVWVLTKEVK